MCATHPPQSLLTSISLRTHNWPNSDAANLCSARHNYHFHFSQHTTYTLRSTLATPFNRVRHLADWGQTNHSWRRKAEKDLRNPTETKAVDCHKNGRRGSRRATRWGEQGEVLACIIFSSSLTILIFNKSLFRPLLLAWTSQTSLSRQTSLRVSISNNRI